MSELSVHLVWKVCPGSKVTLHTGEKPKQNYHNFSHIFHPLACWAMTWSNAQRAGLDTLINTKLIFRNIFNTLKKIKNTVK